VLHTCNLNGFSEAYRLFGTFDEHLIESGQRTNAGEIDSVPTPNSTILLQCSGICGLSRQHNHWGRPRLMVLRSLMSWRRPEKAIWQWKQWIEAGVASGENDKERPHRKVQGRLVYVFGTRVLCLLAFVLRRETARRLIATSGKVPYPWLFANDIFFII